MKTDEELQEEREELKPYLTLIKICLTQALISKEDKEKTQSRINLSKEYVDLFAIKYNLL